MDRLAVLFMESFQNGEVDGGWGLAGGNARYHLAAYSCNQEECPLEGAKVNGDVRDHSTNLNSLRSACPHQ